MNKSAVYLAIFAVLCVLAGVLAGAGIAARRPDLPWHGQDGAGFRLDNERFMGYGQRNFKERKRGEGLVEMLAEKLDLRQDQKAKVKDILEKTRQELEGVRRDVRGAITRIKEKSDNQIMNILDPRQQEKFSALQKEFQKRRGPGGPAGNNEPPMKEGGPDAGEEIPPPPHE